MATDKRGFWDTIGGLGSALTGGGSGSTARLAIEKLEDLLEKARARGDTALVAYLEQDIAEKKAKVEADIWEGGKEPGTPEGMIGSSTAGSGWSMGKYAPTQVVQQNLMPPRILPREEEEMYNRGSLFGMNPYGWYS